MTFPVFSHLPVPPALTIASAMINILLSFVPSWTRPPTPPVAITAETPPIVEAQTQEPETALPEHGSLRLVPLAIETIDTEEEMVYTVDRIDENGRRVRYMIRIRGDHEEEEMQELDYLLHAMARRTAFDEAAWRLHVDAGIDLNQQDDNGYTALHVAVAYRQEAMVVALLNAGARPDIQNELGDTPLHLAVLGRQEAMVVALLNAGACPDIQNEQGDTPLHLAVVGQDFDMVQHLLGHHARPFIQNHQGDTPLHLAFSYRSTIGCLIQILLNHWCMERLSLGSIKNKDGQSIIDLMVLSHTRDELILENGLHVMARGEFNAEAFDQIMGSSDRDWANEPNRFGYTPLHLAIVNHNRPLIAALVQNDARLDLQNILGDTPLHLAVRYRLDTATIQILLDSIHDDITMIESVRNRLGESIMDLVNLSDELELRELFINASVAFANTATISLEDGCAVPTFEDENQDSQVPDNKD